jgi:hypothetical protein
MYRLLAVFKFELKVVHCYLFLDMCRDNLRRSRECFVLHLTTVCGKAALVCGSAATMPSSVPSERTRS